MIKCHECGAEYYDEQTICLICNSPLQLDYPVNNDQSDQIILKTDEHYNILGILTKREYQIDVYQNGKYNTNAVGMLFISFILLPSLIMANINLIYAVGYANYNFFFEFLIGMILLLLLLLISFFAFLVILRLINVLNSPYTKFWGLFRIFSYIYFIIIGSITGLELLLLLFTGSFLGISRSITTIPEIIIINYALLVLGVIILGPIPYKNIFESNYIKGFLVIGLTTLINSVFAVEIFLHTVF